MFKTRFISMLALLLMAVSGAWATITVTWNNDDIPGTGDGTSFTKDGVTITAGDIDFGAKNFMQDGTFTTTLGNFTKIEVTAMSFDQFSGTGWSGSDTKQTWTGNASSVSFNGNIMGMMNLPFGNINFVFTIEPATVAVTGVTLSQPSATLTVGETETLTATVLPGDATDKSVTWSSSDETVATVTDGVVTAVAAGEATITVTTTDGAKTATCAVTVAAPAASTYTVTLKEGTEDATSWTIAPPEATTTGVAAGTEVKATYGGTKKVKSVKAKKKAAVPVTAITLNKTETSIKVGATETLSVTAVAPDNATDKTYTWKTSDETKATVDQDGKVTAVAAGTVTIYAEANDGSGVKGNCAVTVTPATITVTWNNNDITGSGNSFTKDGVTITAEDINFDNKNFEDGGTFTTTLGNFTKIEVTAGDVSRLSGTGWSGNYAKKTWTGNASSVSFSGNIMGGTNFVFTIEPTN